MQELAQTASTTNEQSFSHLSNTGERMIPDAEENLLNLQVHQARYAYAQKMMRSTWAVLDYGCGTGYGLQYLAQFTDLSCVGIDKEESVAYAKQRYPRKNSQYIAGDVTSQTARYGKFDLIVSFDVIEHLDNIDGYLQNIAEQLRDDSSIALISTPWSFRQNNLFPLHNSYHTCELTLTEFFNWLDRYFTIDDLLLTLGMMAKVRRKNNQSNDLGSMAIPLSGAHVMALEASIEQLSSHIESLSMYVKGIEALGKRVAKYRDFIGTLPSLSLIQHPAYNEYVLQPLTAATRLTATFVSEHENLSAIAIPLVTTDLVSNTIVRLTLYRNAIQVADVSVPAVLVLEDCPQRFVFSPIPDSKNVEFSFVLALPEETFDKSINVWCDQQGHPLFQPYFKRYRWDGTPHYTSTAEYIAGSYTLPVHLLAVQVSKQAKSWFPVIDSWLRKQKPLPPVHRRQWPADTPVWAKLWYSLRTYGVAATLNEVILYIQWRRRHIS